MITIASQLQECASIVASNAVLAQDNLFTYVCISGCIGPTVSKLSANDHRKFCFDSNDPFELMCQSPDDEGIQAACNLQAPFYTYLYSFLFTYVFFSLMSWISIVSLGNAQRVDANDL
jgi:hypothetical protein